MLITVRALIIYIQTFLQSDWWRASQFILNVVQKCEIECRKLKLVQKRFKMIDRYANLQIGYLETKWRTGLKRVTVF